MSETFRVSEEYGNRRLDEALSSYLGLSRAEGKRMVKEGRVILNGKKILKASATIRENDLIEFERPEEKPSDLIPEKMDLDIVYEDEDILIINKPQGLVVHPGNGHNEGTLVNGLLYKGMDLADSGEGFRPGLVHRIDKDTSGLLAVAKSDLAMESLREQLSDHSMAREYQAIVLGRIDEAQAKIDAPLGRDIKRATRFAVVPKGGKEALTYFEVLERFSTHTYIKCRLFTGRTHQIRVHMEYIGHPVEGDPLYGSGNRKLYDKGQLLHAGKLVLVHPRSHERMEFSAPLPSYFEEVLGKLRQEK